MRTRHFALASVFAKEPTIANRPVSTRSANGSRMATLARDGLVLLTLVTAACGSAEADDEVSEQTESEIVSGREHETGYAPAGYIVDGASFAAVGKARTRSPQCGVTLIQPQVAVTAAHCLEKYVAAGSVISKGVVFNQRQTTTESVIPTRVIGAILHANEPERYLDSTGSRWRPHDVAIMLLESPVQGAALATLPATQPWPWPDDTLNECTGRVVGYGRTTVGAPTSAEGYTGERKSLGMCVVSSSADLILTQTNQGASCYGDSGSGLFRQGTNIVFGVASSIEGVVCDPGNNPRTGFSTVGAGSNRTFVECASAYGRRFLTRSGNVPDRCMALFGKSRLENTR
jgi:hypothetical protein